MPESIRDIAPRLFSEAPAPALSALAELAKRQAPRREIAAFPGLADQVIRLLRSPEPKVRKNAARLLGALRRPGDAIPLSAALTGETTLFVVPSLLLALGSVGGDGAKAALSAYRAPVSHDETEDKHCREIVSALHKARAVLSADAPLPVYAPAAAKPTLLCAPEGFARTLLEELREEGVSASLHPRGALLSAKDLAGLFRARCFSELLLPLATGVPFDPPAIAQIAAPALTLPYRVELRLPENEPMDRRAFLTRLVPLLGGENNPSHYALELRIEKRGARCDLFLKPSLPDSRFAYRKQALPASIAPALAACLARVVLSFYAKRKNQRKTEETPSIAALDPFCGSGTLLFELEKRLAALHIPCRALIGADIAAAAISAARQNASAADSAAQFVQKDALRLAPREPFDLIVSNLPFGNRVGSHGNNERLYRDFVRRLPDLLLQDGVALLYTMEYRLLKDCVKGVPALTVLSTQRTEAGGLLPWVFLLEKRPPAERTVNAPC